MTKKEWNYLKSINKGRKLEAYETLPVSKPFWSQPTVLVLTIYLLVMVLIKLALKN